MNLCDKFSATSDCWTRELIADEASSSITTFFSPKPRSLKVNKYYSGYNMKYRRSLTYLWVTFRRVVGSARSLLMRFSTLLRVAAQWSHSIIFKCLMFIVLLCGFIDVVWILVNVLYPPNFYSLIITCLKRKPDGNAIDPRTTTPNVTRLNVRKRQYIMWYTCNTCKFLTWVNNSCWNTFAISLWTLLTLTASWQREEYSDRISFNFSKSDSWSSDWSESSSDSSCLLINTSRGFTFCNN